MSHILKFTEWQSASGQWYTNDTSDLAHGSGYWWHAPRMLGIEFTDYVLMLKEKFNVTNFHYNKDKNVLIWYWDNYADCHRFTLYINNQAKKRKFFV